MQPRNVSSFLLLLTASLTVATAAQLKVFRGTLVHSRVRTEMEVLQDHVIGFDANNSGRVSTNIKWLPQSRRCCVYVSVVPILTVALTTRCLKEPHVHLMAGIVY